MSKALTHPMTAPRDRALSAASARWMVVGAGATGVEYYGVSDYVVVRGWGVLTTDEHSRAVSVDLRTSEGMEFGPGVLEGDIGSDEIEQAALEAAWASPALESEPLPAAELTGNLVADARALTGLTAREFGSLFGRTERAGQEWRRHGVPLAFRAQVEALRAIGLTLFGGLGAEGVKRWLLSGQPSPWERIQRGEIAQVAEELRALEDSLAT